MIYDLLADFYDEINSDLDYVKWADFIEQILKNEYNGKIISEGKLHVLYGGKKCFYLCILYR